MAFSATLGDASPVTTGASLTSVSVIVTFCRSSMASLSGSPSEFAPSETSTVTRSVRLVSKSSCAPVATRSCPSFVPMVKSAASVPLSVYVSVSLLKSVSATGSPTAVPPAASSAISRVPLSVAGNAGAEFTGGAWPTRGETFRAVLSEPSPSL